MLRAMPLNYPPRVLPLSYNLWLGETMEQNEAYRTLWFALYSI